MDKFVEEALGFRVERADIFEEMTLGAHFMLVHTDLEGRTIRREALTEEVRMWRLLTSPQNVWQEH